MPPPKWKTREILKVEAIERFWRKVDKNGPIPDQSNPHYKGLGQCWQWTGNVCCNYGRMKFLGKQDKAHRLSKQIELGRELDGNEWVIHKCDNSLCVNPAHLYIGNHHQNVMDRTVRDRTPKGQSHPCSKLTNSQFEEILFRYQKGERPIDLAKEFNITSSHVCGIGKGRYAR